MAVHIGVLEELVAVDHVPEALLVDEGVGVAIALALARRPCGVRDAPRQRWLQAKQRLEHCVLADTAGTGQYDEPPPWLLRRAHLTRSRAHSRYPISSAGGGEVKVRGSPSAGCTKRSSMA